jgi:ribosomal protein S3
MGHKVNPIGLRLQINRTWDSRWFANTKEYGDLLHEDLKIRAFIKKEAAQAGVSRVVIERPHRKCRVTIYTARPGVIIGKKGADIENLRKKVDRALADLTFSRKRIADDVKKCLQSAIANAENNHNLDVDELVVAEAFVGKNLVLKRGRPRARGRFGRIMKPFSELTLKVRQLEEQA